MSWREEVARIDDIVTKKNNWDTLEKVRFIALSITGEAGELANEIKKEWRANGTHNWNQEEWTAFLTRVRLELADLHMLEERMHKALGINIDEACEEKIKILKSRPAFKPFMGDDNE